MTRREVIEALRALRYVHEGKVHFSNYTSPGSYPLVFVFSGDGDVARPSSVAAELYRVLRDARDNPRECTIIGLEPYYEGPTETDCLTGESIESAYGDPDAEESVEP